MRVWDVEHRRQEFSDFYEQEGLGVQGIGSRHGVIENEMIKSGAALRCHPMDVRY